MQQVLTPKSIGLERAVHLKMPKSLYQALRIEAIRQETPFGQYCVNRLQQSPPAAAPAPGVSP